MESAFPFGTNIIHKTSLETPRFGCQNPNTRFLSDLRSATVYLLAGSHLAPFAKKVHPLPTLEIAINPEKARCDFLDGLAEISSRLFGERQHASRHLLDCSDYELRMPKYGQLSTLALGKISSLPKRR